MLKIEKLESDKKYTGGHMIDKPIFNIYRTKIPGGWLVLMRQYDYEEDKVSDTWAYGWGYGGMTFVPDPNHQWKPGRCVLKQLMKREIGAGT